MTATSIPAATPTKARKEKPLRRGAVRDNVEAFGAAILAAVLLKWFCIEAFVIPTSSMQPTLMGCSEASVYDRLLVDKSRYELFAPQRWDIAVFHYPLQKNQNYVKRIVGLENERLHIGGGNLYLVRTDNGKTTYTALRKPARIQQGQWKELFPLRSYLREKEVRALGEMWSPSPRQAWDEADGTFTVTLEPDRTGRITFRDDEDGGLTDRVWDGYTASVGTAMRKAHLAEVQDRGYLQAYPAEIVPDAKLAATVEAARGQEFAFEIEVLRPGRKTLVFALETAKDKAQLCVREGDNRNLVLHGEPFDLPLTAGGSVELGFAHVDDMLQAFVGGRQVQELDVGAWPTMDGCELTGSNPTDNQRVNAQILLKGAGTARLRGVQLWRDQHYIRSTRAPDHVIEVPAGHYFMMGDNTRQSVDGRDWTAFTVGVVTKDGRQQMVPPDEAEAAGGRKVRGNKRPVSPLVMPDRDETPVVFPDRNLAVMIDEYGEILRLDTQIPGNYLQEDNKDGKRRSVFAFEKLGNKDHTGIWVPPEEKVSFVPRSHVVGRALVGFWPVWPWRLGTYR